MLIGYFAIALSVLCLVGGVISVCLATYYVVKTMGGFRPERRWGQYVPFSLFMPRSLQATGTPIASGFYVLVVSFFSSWVLALPLDSVHVRKCSNFLLTSLVASVFLFGCDANLRKQLFLHGALKDGASLQQRVEVSFNAFAMKEGFSCGSGNALPVLRSCRAAGPRFLELHRSQSSFTIFLDQPYPGGIMSKVPKNYVAASEELESVFKSEFGSVVVVVSK